jgi:hypothetical protein
MKNKKELHILLSENLFNKLSDISKSNNLSLTKIIEIQLEKSFVKNKNDYDELITFFKSNFVDKDKSDLYEIKKMLKNITDKFTNNEPKQNKKTYNEEDMWK